MVDGVAEAGHWLEAALALEAWMRARDFAGYDPHDLLGSPLVRRLTLGSRWLAVAWTQLGKRSPVQLRPLLGVRPTRNAKALGLALSSYARLDAVTGDPALRDRAAGLVAELERMAVRTAGGAGWGYPFPWANRSFMAPAGTPSSVVTAFVAAGLLDASDRFGDERAERLAREAGTFLRRGLRRIPGPDGTFAFSYTPLDERVVHNASVLAGATLARLGARGDAAAAEDALTAGRFTVRAQRRDGSWPYGAASRDGWVDGFHTGYTLVALREIGRALETDELEPAVRAGLDYWRRTFLGGPAVRSRPGADLPVDLHGVAHAILTLLTFRGELPGAAADAERLAEWSVREMRSKEGYFYYMRGRRGVNRLAYMRWVQAWMLRALAELAAGAGAPPRFQDRSAPGANPWPDAPIRAAAQAAASPEVH